MPKTVPGLCTINGSSTPAARIVWQIIASELGGGNARCVTSLGDLAFVGTDSGWLSMVELGTGVVLNQVPANAGGDYGYYTDNYAYYSEGESRKASRRERRADASAKSEKDRLILREPGCE